MPVEDQVKELEDWRKKTEAEFDSDTRSKLKELAQSWKSWRNTAGVLAMLFGVAGVAGVWKVYDSVKSEIENQKTAIEKRLAETNKAVDEQKSAIDKRLGETNKAADENIKTIDTKVAQARSSLDSHLKLLVAGETWKNAALEDAKAEFTKTFENDLNTSAFVNMTTALAGLTMILEMESQRESVSRTNIHDPYLITDVLYAVNDIARQYGSRLASGNLAGPRKQALVFLVNGMVDQAHSRQENAMRWFTAASQLDPKMAEPRIFMARIASKGLEYLGKKQWSDEKVREEVVAELKECRTLASQSTPSEIVRLEAEILRFESNFDEALKRVSVAINAEGAEVDPRLHFRKGYLLWEKSRDLEEAAEAEARKEAAQAMLTASQIEPSYLRALNNHIWMCSHRNDAEDSVRTIEWMTPQQKAEYQIRVGILQNEPIVKNWDAALNTLADARVALGDLEEAEELAKKAVRQGQLWLDFSRSSNVTRLARMEATVRRIRELKAKASAPTSGTPAVDTGLGSSKKTP